MTSLMVSCVLLLNLPQACLALKLPMQPEHATKGILQAPRSKFQYSKQMQPPLSPESLPPIRLYCAVPFVWDPSNYNAIMLTWGLRCDVIRFFVDPTNVTNLPRNVVELAMTRMADHDHCINNGGPRPSKFCKHVWEKVWRMWVWIYKHDSDQADWFAKVDSDTYLFPYNLKRFVIRKSFNSNDQHYFGHKLMRSYSIPERIAGAAEFLSKRTLTSIGPVLTDMPSGPITGWTDATITQDRMRCVDRPGPFEEDSMSRCLKSIGVNAEDTLEADGREGVMIFKPEAHLSMSQKDFSWYWIGKPNITGSGADCCSHAPLALHPYSPGQLIELDDFVYTRKGFTIVLNTYSRDACIEELVPHWLSCSPRQLRIVWNDVGRPLPDFLTTASLNSGGVLVIDKHVSRNVTNRFMPFEYQTRAIFNIDDDITYSCSDLWAAYARWNAQPKRAVGFANAVRLIDGRGPRGYHTDDAHYNAIFVSKGAFLHRHYYDLYFSESFAAFRDEVNLRGTGEDILMSFVHASASQPSGTPALECITAAYRDNLPCGEGHGAKRPLYFEPGEAGKRKAVVDLLNASHLGLPRLGQLPCPAHLHDA